MEHTFDVPPVATVELYGFADCAFEPLPRVLFGGGEETLADERSNGADVLLIEAEDTGRRFDCDITDADAGAQRDFAGAGTCNQAAGARVVEHVDTVGAARAREVEGEERPEGDTAVEPGNKTSTTTTNASERVRRSVQRPYVTGRDEGSIAPALLEDARREEEREDVSGAIERGEDGRKKGVGDGGCAADGRESIEV